MHQVGKKDKDRTWLRRLVFGFSWQRLGFGNEPGFMRSVVDKVERERFSS